MNQFAFRIGGTQPVIRHSRGCWMLLLSCSHLTRSLQITEPLLQQDVSFELFHGEHRDFRRSERLRRH